MAFPLGRRAIDVGGAIGMAVLRTRLCGASLWHGPLPKRTGRGPEDDGLSLMKVEAAEVSRRRPVRTIL